MNLWDARMAFRGKLDAEAMGTFVKKRTETQRFAAAWEALAHERGVGNQETHQSLDSGGATVILRLSIVTVW